MIVFTDILYRILDQFHLLLNSKFTFKNANSFNGLILNFRKTLFISLVCMIKIINVNIYITIYQFIIFILFLNISQDPPRGIITFDYARFFNCEINNTPILSHAFFPNGKLNITNSAVNYHLGNQAVRALNRGLKISNSNFTVSDGTAIYSNNLDYQSYINYFYFTES